MNPKMPTHDGSIHAFPMQFDNMTAQRGMSLVDYYAGQAMQSLLSEEFRTMLRQSRDSESPTSYARLIAGFCFDMGVAMNDERLRRINAPVPAPEPDRKPGS